MSTRPGVESSEAAGRRDELHAKLRTFQRHPAYLLCKDGARFVRQLVPNCVRLASYRRRALPSVVIVGAQKAGTTQLFANLIRHPRVFGGVRKELHYFSKHPNWPAAWYQSRFPLRSRLEEAGGLCLEASPSYLPSPDAIRRIRRMLPDALLVVVLRDPVARAFSHYQHDKARRRQSRSFADVVAEGIDRNRDLRPTLNQTIDRPLLDYVARGYYALQLGVVLSEFPREQVEVIDSGDLFADTNGVCRRLFARLGLEAIDLRTDKIFNRGYYRETIDPSAAEGLREHYRPHDEFLGELLGRRFSWFPAVSTTPRNAA